MLPQDGVGGRTPRPRNESPASTVTTTGTSMLARISSGPMMFGQHVDRKDAGGAGAERALGQDEFRGFQGQSLGAHDPAVDRHRGHDQDQDHHLEAGAGERHGGEREHDGRERAQGVEQEQQHAVEPARAVAREHAEQEADDQRDRDRPEGDLERHPAAEEDAREGVAAELVGAGEVGERGAAEPCADVERVWVVGGEPVGEERAGQEQGDQDQAREALRIAEQAPQSGEALRTRIGNEKRGKTQRLARTRGSSQAMSRSASSAQSTNRMVVTSTAPWTTG